MNNVRLIDKSFDIAQCELYTLSIRLSPDGFSFCIYSPVDCMPLAVVTIPTVTYSAFHLKNELNQILKDEILLKQKFGRIVVSYISKAQSISPLNFIPEEELDNVFKFTHKSLPEETIMHYPYTPLKITFSYSIPSVIKTFLQSNFIGACIIPESLPLVIKACKSNDSNDKIWVSQQNHTLEIITTSEGYINTFNTFFAKNENDILYYTVCTARQLQNKESQNVEFFGFPELSPSLSFLLKKYNITAKTGDLTNIISPRYKWGKQLSSCEILLIEQSLCV